MISHPADLIQVDTGLMKQGFLQAFQTEDLDFFGSKLSVDPNLAYAVFESGNTLAHYAVVGGCNSVLRLLCESGVLIDLINGFGDVPLHLAASFCNLEALRLLLEFGVDPERRDGQGDTILHCASNYFVGQRGYCECELDWSQRPPIVHWLLQRFPALLELSNKAGETAFCQAFSSSTYCREADDTLRALLVQGANPNVRDPEGNTVAHLWGSEGNQRAEPLEMALEFGLDLGLKNHKSQTALECLLGYYTHRKPPELRVALLTAKGVSPIFVDKEAGM